MRILAVLLLTVSLLGFMLTGCGPSEPAIDLPETSVLLNSSSVALILEPYLRLHDRPDVTAGVIGHGRRGEVLSVIGMTADRRWVELEGPSRYGWARSELVMLYASREQASSARRVLDDR